MAVCCTRKKVKIPSRHQWSGYSNTSSRTCSGRNPCISSNIRTACGLAPRSLRTPRSPPPHTAGTYTQYDTNTAQSNTMQHCCQTHINNTMEIQYIATLLQNVCRQYNRNTIIIIIIINLILWMWFALKLQRATSDDTFSRTCWFLFMNLIIRTVSMDVKQH